jgi:HK97 family phage prohead protease
MKTDEIRTLDDSEFRVIDGAEGAMPKIVGYAAVFNSLSNDLGGFREKIQPGAFSEALSPDREILALVQHDPGRILGRRTAGTLTLKEDERGLWAEISPPNTTVGRDAVENIRRGDMKGMSFRFNQPKDSWSRDGTTNVRSIKSFGIIREVTLTAVPAYEATTAEVRAALDMLDKEAAATPKRDAAKRRLFLARTK